MNRILTIFTLSFFILISSCSTEEPEPVDDPTDNPIDSTGNPTGPTDIPTDPANNSTSAFLRVGTRWDFYYNTFLGTDTIGIEIEEQLGADTFLVRNYAEEIAVIPTQYWVMKDDNLYVSFRLRD